MGVARKRGNRLWRNLALAVALLIALFIAYVLWLKPGGATEAVVRIPEHASFEAILDSLDRSGVVSNRAAFKLLARATGKDARIRPGTYKFRTGTAAAELLDALVEGRSTVRARVTFPEGITVRRVASIAHRVLGTDSVQIVRLASDRAFLTSIGINAQTIEGYLMPDTYFLPWGEDAAQLLKRMSEEFRAFYADDRKEKAKELGLTPYEAVILASIVEGEARVDDERPVIAGLYLNRLHRGMKLAADPTIQYAIPDGPRRLRYSDLRIDSPYNTYLREGLPPTPINNPGRASLLAVLSPQKHDYIYMVARADGSGRHTFSRTAAEHERAVREFRANRAASAEDS